MNLSNSSWPRFVTRSPAHVDPDFAASTADGMPASELQDLRCAILLGEPGLGKSQVLASLSRSIPTGDRMLLFNLGALGPTEIERRLREDATDILSSLGDDGALHLFFDGVDETALTKKQLASLLTERLRSLPLERLRLRFASRPVDWPDVLQRELEMMLSDIGRKPEIRWLLPLRWADVEIAADAVFRAAARPFLDQVRSARLEPLASRPISLLLLLRLWHRDGELPATRKDVYERGLLRMLDEARSSHEHRKPPSAEESYRVAQCVAGLMLIGGRPSIWSGPAGEEPMGVLTAAEIRGAFKTALGARSALPGDVEALLSIAPLGGSDPLGEWHWAHRSFAEFLAAKWLSNSSASDDTLILLLTAQDIKGERRVIPQLAGVAAWLVDLRSTLFQRLLAYEPELVLQTDLNAREERDKQRVVEALLSAAARPDRVDQWDWDFEQLRHSNLADQLRPWIGDCTRDFFGRRTAVRIAEECKVDGLEAELLQVLGEERRGNLQSLAASALVESYGRNGRWADIQALANLPMAQDHDDEILGAVLETLWPDHLDIATLVSLLRPPRKRWFFGRYFSFLVHDFVSGLRPEQWSVVIRWFAEQRHRRKQPGGRRHSGWSSHQLGDLWKALAQRFTHNQQWKQLGVLDALIGPLHDQDASPYDEHGERVAEVIRNAPMLCHRAFLEHLVEHWTEHPESSARIAAFMEGPSSFHEALRLYTEHVHRDTAMTAACASLARQLFHPQQPEHLDALLEVAARHPEAHTDFGYVLELGRTKDEILAEIERRRPRPTNSRPTAPLNPSPAERIAKRLARVFEGQAEFFPDLVFVQLALAPGATVSRVDVPQSIDTTPGWQSADLATRRDIDRAARVWLEQGNPNEEQWRGTNHLPAEAIAGILAAAHLHVHAPEAVAELTNETWERWALALLVGSTSLNWNSHPIEVLERAMEANPSAFVHRLGKHIRGTSAPSVYLNRLRAVWRPELSQLMRELIVEHRGDVEGADDVFDYACAWMHQERAPRAPIVERYEDFALPVRAAIMAAELKADPEGSWDRVWPWLSTDDELARLVFPRVARGETRRSSFTLKVSAAHKAAMVERVAGLFPPEEDPHHDGAHIVGDRESVADFRNSLLRQIAEMGTSEAAEALSALQERGVDKSGTLGLRQLVEQSIQRAIATQWAPLPLDSITRIVEGGRRAVVYLSSRFESCLRESAKACLSQDYEVIVTEGEARSLPVLESIRDDVERANVVVQLLEWSLGLGPRDGTGGSYLEQEQIVARILHRDLLIGVLQDDRQCPPELGKYLSVLRQRVILLEQQDIETLVSSIKSSVDRRVAELLKPA